MVEVKICNLSLANTIMRYYLLMAIVLVGGFSGLWWFALLALPVFVSTLLGVSIKWEPFVKNSKKAKVVTLKEEMNNKRKVG